MATKGRVTREPQELLGFIDAVLKDLDLSQGMKIRTIRLSENAKTKRKGGIWCIRKDSRPLTWNRGKTILTALKIQCSLHRKSRWLHCGNGEGMILTESLLLQLCGYPRSPEAPENWWSYARSKLGVD